MTIIRQANPETDYAELAQVLQQIWPELITEEILHEFDRDSPPGRIRRRTVAISDSGHIIGTCITVYNPWMESGKFFTWSAVLPSERGKGVGSRLYSDGIKFAEQYGVDSLDSEVRDNEPDSLRFAKRRGFEISRHIFESVIELDGFDERPFAGLIESVEAGGIRLLSLAEAGMSEEMLRKLHAANARVSADDPGGSGIIPDFEHYRDNMVKSSGFLSEGQFMALDGEKVIGLASVGNLTANKSMFNMMTGIDRAYRGRKIAQALKLLTIRFARDYGAAAIRTHNDSENGPMLAINRKLGYQPEPGFYRLVKKAVDGVAAE